MNQSDRTEDDYKLTDNINRHVMGVEKESQ